MGRALDVTLKVIPSKVANPFVRAHHYSGKVVNNSSLHFGAFLDGRLHGAMSFGPPMQKSNLIGLVEGTGWSNLLELNRMAFDDVLPRNSESRCISLAMRSIRRHAPQVKWVVSFADGCSCGDGTIYRASNFVLTGIKRNTTILELPDGTDVADLTLSAHRNQPMEILGGMSPAQVCGGSYGIKKFREATGAKEKPGYMLRYVYFIDPRWRKRLTVPEIPFSRIDELGAGMYRGWHVSVAERHVDEWCRGGVSRGADGQAPGEARGVNAHPPLTSG